MSDSIVSTYPVDFERTAIAVGYSNNAYIADMVLPRVSVARKEYRYTEYPIEESFSVPDTRVGRRSSPTMVHFTGKEQSGACEDYGLEDLIPEDDVRNAPPTAANPIDRSTMMLTDLLMIDREQRVADLVFNTASFGAESKVTLAGTDQWSSTNAASDPVEDVVGAIEKMIVKPTHFVLGSEVWKYLRTHTTILKSINRTDGDKGIASRAQVEDLLEVKLVIGQAWINSAKRGQKASLKRVWGKHALLYRADPNASAMGPPTLGITAQYMGREVRTGFNARAGARGGHQVRVIDTCDEKIIASRAGYLFRNAVA